MQLNSTPADYIEPHLCEKTARAKVDNIVRGLQTSIPPRYSNKHFAEETYAVSTDAAVVKLAQVIAGPAVVTDLGSEPTLPNIEVGRSSSDEIKQRNRVPCAKDRLLGSIALGKQTRHRGTQILNYFVRA